MTAPKQELVSDPKSDLNTFDANLRTELLPQLLTESCYLLGSRVDPEAAAALLELAGTAFAIWELPSTASTRAASLMRQYHALPMDLADASAVLLAEHQKDGRILSTHRRDFNAYRWKDLQPFRNLLFED